MDKFLHLKCKEQSGSTKWCLRLLDFCSLLFQDMTLTFHAYQIERFFGEKVVKKMGRRPKISNFLSPFRKRVKVDEQLCQIWALFSYPFLRSILKKGRKT